MSNSKEIRQHKISKPIKDIGQCKRSNTINGDFWQTAKEKPCVDITVP